MANLEKELVADRELGMRKIEHDLTKKKAQRLADMEKKLEKLKNMGGRSAKEQIELGDLLHEYGKLVNKVESELVFEKAR